MMKQLHTAMAILLTIALFLSLSVESVAKNINSENEMKSSFEKPDFAYPETVIKDAQKVLNKALKSGDEILIVDAALQIVAAKEIISESSLVDSAEMIDSIAQTASPQLSAILYSIESSLYSNLYMDNGYIYRNREVPLDSISSDPTEWSKEIYAMKINELVKKSLKDADILINSPISDYKRLLKKYDDDIALFYPSLYDLIAYRSIYSLTEFKSDGVIPFGDMSSQKNISAEVQNTIDETIASLKSYHLQRAEIGAYVAADITEMEITQSANLSDRLYAAYQKMKDSEYSTEYLITIISGVLNYSVGNRFSVNSLEYNHAEINDLVNICRTQIADFPNYVRIDQLSELLHKLLSDTYIEAETEPQYIKNEHVKVKVNVTNCKKGYLHLYKASKKSVIKGSSNGPGEKVGVYSFEIEDNPPFKKEIEVDLGILDYGYYSLEVSEKSKIPTPKSLNHGNADFVVSDIIAVFASDKSNSASCVMSVVDIKSGQPVEGAVVTYKYDDKTKDKKHYITDKNGDVELPLSKNHYIIENGDDYMYDNYSGYYFYNRDNGDDDIIKLHLFTDLSIYRPGDKVKFVALAYIYNNKTRKYCDNQKVIVSLRGGSYKDIKSIELITDSVGRAVGEFELPTTGVLGSYDIVASTGNKNVSSYHQIRVEEYKAPTFYVECSEIKANYSAGDTIEIKGKVKSFSNMPIAEAEVKFKVETMSWWRTSVDASFADVTRTDKNGEFIILLSTDNLKGTPYSRCSYILETEVTSQNGETQAGVNQYFVIGEDYMICPNLSEIYCADSEEINLAVTVNDMLGKGVECRLNYEMVDIENEDIRFAGEFVSPTLTINAKDIPSGKYKINFYLLEDTTVNAESNIVIYRTKDKRAPYTTPLFVPDNRVTLQQGQKNAKLKIYSSYNDAQVLCLVSNSEGMISRKWIENRGAYKVEVPTPADYDRVWVELFAVRNKEIHHKIVEVIPAEATKQLEVTTISFRERIDPTSKEQWVFKLKYADAKAPYIPVLATMSDKALNSIYPFIWRFSPDYYYVKGGMVGYHYLSPGMSRYKNVASWPNVKLDMPKLNLYGIYSGYYDLGMFDYDSPLSFCSDARPSSVVYGTRKLGDANILSESAAVEESVTLQESQDLSEVKMRDVECPTAFFYPSLMTDKEGEVEVSFEVPNYNTTWQFQLFGYTDKLKTALFTQDVIANKSVMVQSHLPRFLRTGDKALLKATMFNNSDTVLPVSGKIEIFNPDTGQLLHSYESSATEIEPMGSCVISIEYAVPDTLSAIGCRFYAISERHTDGEQSLLSVLPSSSPVIESHPFYLGTGAKTHIEQLPEYSDQAQVTLDYCDNPVWYCVTALPDIVESRSSSILDKVRVLYGNAISAGLASRYPQINKAITLWMEDTSCNQVLQSQLNRNSELKIVELENTIWTNDAAAETKRMQRLSTLLDSAQNKVIISNLVSEIANKQESDGGWKWCDGMESSVYITSSVLLYFAMLSDMDLLPEDANVHSMISKGVIYCDRKLEEEYNTYKFEGMLPDMINYLYIRSFFDMPIENRSFAKIKNAALKEIERKWKELDIYYKATSAILLNREGYKKVAEDILESLRQYATKTENKGMYYDNLNSSWSGHNKLITTAQVLEAYHEISPNDSSIDMLRQWLVLQRQAMDWGVNRYLSEVIYAILSTGSVWIDDYEAAKLYLNGKCVSPEKTEEMTGSFKISLPIAEASGAELKIDKRGEQPAWGGVISQYIANMSDVKSEGIDGLSIEKHIYRIVDGSEQGLLTSVDRLHVGDKVRIQLVIKTDRDMDYVAITDERGACFMPVNQLSVYDCQDYVWSYREVRNSQTNIFIDYLSRGTHVLSYDCYVSHAGEYSVGISTLQCQYAPMLTAHSAGQIVVVSD